MRKITREIVNAFYRGEPLTMSNSRTDGQSLWLFGNKIAEKRGIGLWITNAGWSSSTTKERLNGLNGVNIQQVRGIWYLNGRPWGGQWVDVWDWSTRSSDSLTESVAEEIVQEVEFDVTSEWMEEGYSRPLHSIFHTLVEVELEEVEHKLTVAGIPSRRMESDTEGVYRPNYFIVVYPNDKEKALNTINQ